MSIGLSGHILFLQLYPITGQWMHLYQLIQINPELDCMVVTELPADECHLLTQALADVVVALDKRLMARVRRIGLGVCQKRPSKFD